MGDEGSSYNPNEDRNSLEDRALEVSEYLRTENMRITAEILTAYGKEPIESSSIEPREILPTEEHFCMPHGVYKILQPDIPYEKTHIPRGAHIEFMGMPMAGKSIAAHRLGRRIKKLHFFDEFADLRGKDHMFDSLYALADPEGAISLYLSSLSEHSHNIAELILLEERRARINNDEGDFKPIAIMRGMSDLLGYGLWMYRDLHIENFVENPAVPSLVESSVRSFYDTDALILMTLDYDTAVSRRRKNGLTPTGRIVNEAVWPHIERGYHWWIENVYPIVREKFGTGLLVVDGKNSIRQNVAVVTSYYEKVAALSEQRS